MTNCSLDTSSAAEALVFGAIVSAIDPVATLVLLSDVFKVREKSDVPLIYNLIFGESVINDAIAIVLFRIMIGYVNTTFTAWSIVKITYTFAYVSVGSVAIGLAVGFGTALFFKHVSLKNNTTIEVIVMAMMAFSSYFLAEAATLSGILSLFVCGIVCGRFVWYNLSEYSRLTTPQTFKVFATAAESYVFLYLGISAFAFPNRSDWKFGFIGVAVLLCIVGRILNIVPLTLIANIWRKRKINWRETVFMTFNGLRGAIAFVLALHCLGQTPNGISIVTTVLFLVFISVWICGSLTLPILKSLKLDYGSGTDEGVDLMANMPSAILAINRRVTDIGQISIPKDFDTMTADTVNDEPVVKQSFLKRFDNQVLRPLFRKRKDQTSPRLRDLLLAGSIPQSLKIEELQPDEFESLYEKLTPKQPKTGVQDVNMKEVMNPTQSTTGSAMMDNNDPDFIEIDLGSGIPRSFAAASS
jgi:sodium/hydrogen exchanger 8